MSIKGEWIPVKERVPDEPGTYLVTIKSVAGFNYPSIFAYGKYTGYDGNMYNDAEGFYDHHPVYGLIEHNDDVIAWMPLPDVYQD